MHLAHTKATPECSPNVSLKLWDRRPANPSVNAGSSIYCNPPRNAAK